MTSKLNPGSSNTSWSKRRLPSLDLFKKLKSNNDQAEEEAPHNDLKLRSLPAFFETTKELFKDGDELSLMLESEDVSYDDRDNLARDCREFYERRIRSLGEVAMRWGAEAEEAQKSKVKSSKSETPYATPMQNSANSTCSSGYFSLNASQVGHRELEKRLSAVSNEAGGDVCESIENGQSSMVQVAKVGEDDSVSFHSIDSVASSSSSPSTSSSNEDEGLGSLQKGESSLSSAAATKIGTDPSPSSLSPSSTLAGKIHFLRQELLSLIHLDNELFKQLLTLNDTLEELKDNYTHCKSDSESPLLERANEVILEEDPDLEVINNDNEEGQAEGGSDQEQEINDLLDEAFDLTSLASSLPSPTPVRANEPTMTSTPKSLPKTPAIINQLPVPNEPVIRSQSVLLRSGFQRQRISFPATGKNKRGRGQPLKAGINEAPVKRQLPSPMQPSSLIESLVLSSSMSGEGPAKLSTLTLPSSLVKASKAKKQQMKLEREKTISKDLPPVECHHRKQRSFDSGILGSGSSTMSSTSSSGSEQGSVRAKKSSFSSNSSQGSTFSYLGYEERRVD